MDKELKKYFQMKSLISIYANESNADTFLTGYINEMDDEGMIINHITPYGTYDGYVYIRKEDIFRIEIESKYIKRLEKNGVTLIKIDNIHDCESDTTNEQIIMQIL